MKALAGALATSVVAAFLFDMRTRMGLQVMTMTRAVFYLNVFFPVVADGVLRDRNVVVVCFLVHPPHQMDIVSVARLHLAEYYVARFDIGAERPSDGGAETGVPAADIGCQASAAGFVLDGAAT